MFSRSSRSSTLRYAAAAFGLALALIAAVADDAAAPGRPDPVVLQGSEAPLGAPPEAWPSTRGDAAQTGRSAGTLADELTLRWRYRTEGKVMGGAAIRDGRVYVGSDDGKLHVIDLATGKALWQGKTEAEVQAAPLLLADRVVVGSADGNVYAWALDGGRQLWQRLCGDKVLGAANRFPAPDGKGEWLVFGCYDNRLICLDAATGVVQWSLVTENYINGSPAVSDGKVIIGGCDSVLRVVRAADGEPLGSYTASSYIPGSVAVDEGVAYFGHYGNEVLAVNLATHEKVWSHRDRNFPYLSSPAITETLVVIGGNDRRVHGLSRQTGKTVWTYRTRGQVTSSPVICGERLVVGSADGSLYLLDLKTGTALWSWKIGAPVSASPAVADGCVVVGAEDGWVYCFASDAEAAAPGPAPADAQKP